MKKGEYGIFNILNIPYKKKEMEGKEPIKIRLSTTVLCIIIAILIGGIVYLAVLNNNIQKTKGETENQIGNLQTQVKELENKVEQQQNVEVNTINDKNTNLNQVTDNNTSNTSLNQATDNDTNKISDKYKVITKKLNLNDEEIFVVTDVEKNEGKYTLKGRIYKEYTLSKNEYNVAKNTGKITLNGKEYTAKKEKDSEVLELYDINDKSEYYKYIISYRDDKGYVLNSPGQVDVCYRATNDYRKITVEENIRCEHTNYNGSTDEEKVLKDTTVSNYFRNFKSITEKNTEPSELLPDYNFEFKNGKCIKITIRTIFI